MSKEEKPTSAFITSLLSGLFIIFGGLTVIIMGGAWNIFSAPGWPCFGMMRGWGPWRSWLFMPMFSIGLGIFGLISGIIVVISSMMLNSEPENHAKWGTLILIFSVLSIFGGIGGYGIGLILGVIGGVLAITWRPKSTL